MCAFLSPLRSSSIFQVSRSAWLPWTPSVICMVFPNLSQNPRSPSHFGQNVLEWFEECGTCAVRGKILHLGFDYHSALMKENNPERNTRSMKIKPVTINDFKAQTQCTEQSLIVYFEWHLWRLSGFTETCNKPTKTFQHLCYFNLHYTGKYDRGQVQVLGVLKALSQR